MTDVRGTDELELRIESALHARAASAMLPADAWDNIVAELSGEKIVRIADEAERDSEQTAQKERFHDARVQTRAAPRQGASPPHCTAIRIAPVWASR